MSKTTTRPILTGDHIDAAYENPAWLGFGYLGDRQRGEWSRDDVVLADAAALRQANANGWDEARFFDWLNSKHGRWYADEALGSDGVRGDLEAIARRLVR